MSRLVLRRVVFWLVLAAFATGRAGTAEGEDRAINRQRMPSDKPLVEGNLHEAEDKAVAAVMKLDGTISRDEHLPWKPVSVVRLFKATDADLKELAPTTHRT